MGIINFCMSEEEKTIEERLSEIEKAMNAPDFWQDKARAQEIIGEYNELKAEKEGVGKYDNGPAVMTVFAGAGGLDAEDFAAILVRMYLKYLEKKGFGYKMVHENQNDHGGYRNITFEILGKGAYGLLKNESGVHRLVRLSPFNAKSQRHTSFAMVEVVPKLKKAKDIEIKEEEIDVEFSRSSGPGGQNVNKRETAVRVIHKPTGLAAHSDSERTQQANKEKALSILSGKLYHKLEEDRKKERAGLAVSKTTEAEWGSQIRNYVMHPYQLVKDLRTGVEERNIDKILEEGELDEFIEAEQKI